MTYTLDRIRCGVDHDPAQSMHAPAYSGLPPVLGGRLTDMDVTIYHNPRCSTSRKTLEYLREDGLNPTIIQYLKDTPTKEELQALFDQMGIPVHRGIRTKEAEYTVLGLSEDAPEEELLEAVVAHPRLLERPIVVTGKGARIARPSINVIDEIL